jgi:methionyl-tRNA formyltransferase
MKDASHRVVLLTHDSPEARMMAKEIHQQIPLTAIVVETGHASFVPPRRGMASLVYSVVGRHIYGKARREYHELIGFINHHLRASSVERRVRAVEQQLESAATARFRQDFGVARRWPSDVQRIQVDSINQDPCVSWCKKIDPDIMLCFGTSILKGDILNLARQGVLNAHTSILPEYRGTRAEFWQVLNQDFRHAGVTVHRIDCGVDTGDIIAQERAQILGQTDPWQLRVTNLGIALRLLPSAALAVLNGSATRLPQPPTSTPTYRGRDITLERRLELLRSLGHAITK